MKQELAPVDQDERWLALGGPFCDEAAESPRHERTMYMVSSVLSGGYHLSGTEAVPHALECMREPTRSKPSDIVDLRKLDTTEDSPLGPLIRTPLTRAHFTGCADILPRSRNLASGG